MGAIGRQIHTEFVNFAKLKGPVRKLLSHPDVSFMPLLRDHATNLRHVLQSSLWLTEGIWGTPAKQL